jgi:hypothetical protein|nr:MAG TPA: hypothetical protein [Caudoviricetes sp.]
MSVERFKVGDKVRVRRDLCGGVYYDDIYVHEKMTKLGDTILTVSEIQTDTYEVKENTWDWNDQMLEPATKTLDTLRTGDLVCNDGETRKTLAVVDGCYLLSDHNHHDWAWAWCTVADLKRLNYQPVDIDSPKGTIEINGKRYNKSEVEKVIEDLEPIE